MYGEKQAHIIVHEWMIELCADCKIHCLMKFFEYKEYAANKNPQAMVDAFGDTSMNNGMIRKYVWLFNRTNMSNQESVICGEWSIKLIFHHSICLKKFLGPAFW